MKYKIILILLFLSFFIFFNQKIVAFNLYTGAGIVSSTSFPVNLTTDFDLFIKIYQGDTVFIGILFDLNKLNKIGLEFSFISRGIYSIGDYYYLLFNGLIKSFFSKNILYNKYFQFDVNLGVWISFLFYSAYVRRTESNFTASINSNNFSFINTGIYFSYMFNFSKFGLDISSNIAFIDDNIKDDLYFISSWISFSFIYYL